MQSVYACIDVLTLNVQPPEVVADSGIRLFHHLIRRIYFIMDLLAVEGITFLLYS